MYSTRDLQLPRGNTTEHLSGPADASHTIANFIMLIPPLYHSMSALITDGDDTTTCELVGDLPCPMASTSPQTANQSRP